MSTQVTQSQSVKFSGVSLVTVGLGLETITSVSRVAAQLLGASFVGNMPDYLPRNRDVELLKSLQKSEGCLCIINVDSDRELAMETAVSLQQLLGDRVLLIALSAPLGRRAHRQVRKRPGFPGRKRRGRNDDPCSSSVHVHGPAVREKGPSGGSASAVGSCRSLSWPAGGGISLLRLGPQR